MKEKYDEDRRTFDEDDQRDSNGGVEHGQRVTDSFRMADIILLNNENIAEENAVLNVARVGASAALPASTLFTTTYPCNLYANKIA